MSPRAAWRLEGLGFEMVYDYVPGKADWFASGLPKEGRMASVPTIGDAARQDVPTCAPAEKVENAQDCVRAAGWDACVVVNKERVVLVGKMAARMRGRGAPTALVTTSDGRLVGLLYRDDAERLAGEQP
jgi:CBS domain-containing protein